MKLLHVSLPTLAALALCGCFTISQSEYPPVTVPAVGGDVRLRVSGFDATALVTTSTGGATSTYCSGGHRYWDDSPHFGTVTTTSYVTEEVAIDAYRNRATDMFEKAGCVLRSNDPTFEVEARFATLPKTGGETWSEIGWFVGSIFTADSCHQAVTLSIRVYDLSTGKLVHSAELTESYEALAWGPVPLLSPACSEVTSRNFALDRCRTALVDRAVENVCAFLQGRR